MIAVDSSALIAFLRGDRRLLGVIAKAGRLVLPSFVVAEYLVGVLRGSRGDRQRVIYDRLIANPLVEVLLPDGETSRHYAAIRLQLLDAGTPVGTNDIWIAAICIQHDIPLLTLDEDFRKIVGLRLAAVS